MAMAMIAVTVDSAMAVVVYVCGLYHGDVILLPLVVLSLWFRPVSGFARLFLPLRHDG